MKAQDLRIGDLVKFIPDNEVIKIQGVSPNKDFNDEIWVTFTSIKGSILWSIPIEEVESIELTEEWLLKFGFHDIWPDEADWYFSKEHNFRVLKTRDQNNELSYFLNHYKNRSTPIKHVHQLQNLYFALTGEELNTEKQ